MNTADILGLSIQTASVLVSLAMVALVARKLMPETQALQSAAGLDELKGMEIFQAEMRLQLADAKTANARVERQQHEDALKYSRDLETMKGEHAAQLKQRDVEREELRGQMSKLEKDLEAERRAREALEKRLKEAEEENAKLRKLLEDKDVLIQGLRTEVNALKEGQKDEKTH